MDPSQLMNNPQMMALAQAMMSDPGTLAAVRAVGECVASLSADERLCLCSVRVFRDDGADDEA
jgi:hypothetical protein